MDVEIETLPELEKALADQCTGEVGEVVLPDIAQLRTASDGLDELVSIKAGILKEGVSQEDVRSVFTLIQKLNDAGVPCGLGVSLEDHELGHYTPSRSMVNVRLSQEGIGETVITVVKALLETLVKYIVNAIRWFKVLGAKDKAIERAFETARKKVHDVQEAIVLFRRYSAADNTELEANAAAYAKELLSHGSLPRNYLSLAALFHAPSVDEVKTIHRKVERSCRFLRASVKSLKMFLSNQTADLNIDVTMLEDFADVRTQIAGMQEVSPDQNFLSAVISPAVFSDATVRRQAEPLAQYEYVLKAYYSVADELRSIRKINLTQYNDQAMAMINEVIAELTTAFEDLGLVIEFFVSLKNVQMQVFKLQLSYLNRYASLLYLNARDNAIHEATQKKVQSVFDDLEKKLKNYGI